MKGRLKYRKRMGKWEQMASVLSGEQYTGSDSVADLTGENMIDTGMIWRSFDRIREETTTDTDVDTAWNKLHDRLLNDKLVPGAKATAGITGRLNIILRVAASVLILAIAGYAVFELLPSSGVGMISVKSFGDRNTGVSLPDGSKVTLNRYSTLTYSKKFSEENRLVAITGEAFFEISHKSFKPFRVKAGNAEVEVMGTSFNVNTGGRSKEVEVFVKTGIVRLTVEGSNTGVLLSEGEVGTTRHQGLPQKYVNTNPNYMSWHSGILVYESTPLSTVFADIKKIYGINIVADDSVIPGLLITTVFNNTPEEELVRIISATFNLNWKKKGRDYILSQY